MPTQPNPTEAIKRTVQEFPEVNAGPALMQPIIFNVGQAADEIDAWWSPQRDKQLSAFWSTEPFLAGTVYSIMSRNASFRYELKGPAKDVWSSQQLFAQADFGAGWQTFIEKVTQDLLVVDNGAFIEVIRPARARTAKCTYDAIKMRDPDSDEMIWVAYDRHAGKPMFNLVADRDFKVMDSPLDLPVGIAHLDSLACTRTGDPDFPVVYTDRKGRQHKLNSYQVLTLEDMPSPRQEMNGVGICAVSRCLRLAQIIRDMQVYKHEKIAGRFSRAIHITNVDAMQLQDAIDQANMNNDARGLSRYSQPVILATLSKDAKPEVATINLAILPDGFSEEETMRWYVAGVANAFGVDYGFLAPLPGNKLGTSTQAETQERQAKGKSSRLFMQNLTFKFNFSGILPRTVTFQFSVADPWEESEKDRALARRARALATLIDANIIDQFMARQMLTDMGDLDPKYLAMIGETDITPIITVSGTDMPEPEIPHAKLDYANLVPINNDAVNASPGGEGQGFGGTGATDIPSGGDEGGGE